MAALLQYGLANAAAAGLLAIVALAAGRYCRRPAVLHGLWLLVILKLVTPPVVSLPLPGWPALPTEPTRAAPVVSRSAARSPPGSCGSSSPTTAAACAPAGQAPAAGWDWR